MIAGISVVKAAKHFSAQTLMVFGLVFVAAGFILILLFRHDLSVAAIIVSFIVLELGVGVSQTISNDTIVASVPAAKAGAASAVSETAYELGAVVGAATLGTMTRPNRRHLVPPRACDSITFLLLGRTSPWPPRPVVSGPSAPGEEKHVSPGCTPATATDRGLDAARTGSGPITREPP